MFMASGVMKNIVVIGSGAGGATVAKELSKYDVKLIIIEKGPYIKTKKAYECYETLKTCVDLSKTSCVGGTTLVTLGNAVKTSLDALNRLGIDLTQEFKEVEEELNVNTLPDSHFGDGTKKIMSTAKSLGFHIKKMPKFIDPKLCEPCGKCASGCPKNAKWTALNFVEEAKNSGAKIVENTPITDIMVDNGKIEGVRSHDKVFPADIVILSSGAVETPLLLRRIGINAGDNLFVDTFITIGGVLREVGFNQEIQMNALIEFDEFILSPHFSDILVQKLHKYGTGKKDIIGMMVKIKDEPSGKVRENKVTKYNTPKDVSLLAEGSAIVGSILTQLGVDPKTLVSTHTRGAHPGGTAAIGRVIDKNLETPVKGLFVADASVLPEAPGAPPILTIIALAKRLSRYIVKNHLK